MIKVGIIGVGVVGGALRHWFEQKTTHTIACLDPQKGLNDSLLKSDAIFICIPVPSTNNGQDLKELKDMAIYAKRLAPYVFIKSTVLPGTNDELGTISMPEFLTERRAVEDMFKLPIVCGEPTLPDPNFKSLVESIFPSKEIHFMKNKEAELSKFTHNCFAAIKVTFFNLMHRISRSNDSDFNMVKKGAAITGYIEPTHTDVPGPDGKYGYGGKCFPENMQALETLLWNRQLIPEEFKFINKAIELNNIYRKIEVV